MDVAGPSMASFRAPPARGPRAGLPAGWRGSRGGPQFAPGVSGVSRLSRLSGFVGGSGCRPHPALEGPPYPKGEGCGAAMFFRAPNAPQARANGVFRARTRVFRAQMMFFRAKTARKRCFFERKTYAKQAKTRCFRGLNDRERCFFGVQTSAEGLVFAAFGHWGVFWAAPEGVWGVFAVVLPGFSARGRPGRPLAVGHNTRFKWLSRSLAVVWRLFGGCGQAFRKMVVQLRFRACARRGVSVHSVA
jgi:hypothetical protein